MHSRGGEPGAKQHKRHARRPTRDPSHTPRSGTTSRRPRDIAFGSRDSPSHGRQLCIAKRRIRQHSHQLQHNAQRDARTRPTAGSTRCSTPSNNSSGGGERRVPGGTAAHREDPATPPRNVDRPTRGSSSLVKPATKGRGVAERWGVWLWRKVGVWLLGYPWIAAPEIGRCPSSFFSATGPKQADYTSFGTTGTLPIQHPPFEGYRYQPRRRPASSAALGETGGISLNVTPYRRGRSN